MMGGPYFPDICRARPAFPSHENLHGTRPALRDRTVLVTEGSDPVPLQWLKERTRVIETPYDDPAFAGQLAQADGMVVRTYTRVNDALLDRAPRLQVVGRGGVGLENIDVAACRRRGVEVVYTPDANTLAVGDFVFGYLLQLLRPWAFFRDRVYDPKEFKRIRNTVARPAAERADDRHPGHGPGRPAGRAHRRERLRHAGDLQRPARLRRPRRARRLPRDGGR